MPHPRPFLPFCGALLPSIISTIQEQRTARPHQTAPAMCPNPSGSSLALWPVASTNLTVIWRPPARQSACTETLNVSQTHVVSSTPDISKNASLAVSQIKEREKGPEGVREWTVMATWCVLCSLLGASLPNKEFVEESFKKAFQGRVKDTSAKLTAELERASSGKKGDSLSAFLSLLVKLLSEQEEVKVSKEEPGTNQWKNESYKTKKREATQEQDAQESSELATELPEHGYNSKLVVAIPVIVGAITSIVIFCFIAEDVSSRRQPLWLRDLYRPRSASCIEGMAQKLRDKDSSAEDELYYQM